MTCHRRMLLEAAAASALAVVPAAGSGKGKAPLPIGSRLDLVDLPLIEGGTFKAAEARGKVVVVYWWASWCPFCAEMSPSIEQLWRSQRERGLTVIGLSIDRTAAAARDHRRRKGYTFPSAMHEQHLEPVLPKPGLVPVLWVADRSGRLVMVEQGQQFPEDVADIARFL